MRGLYPLRIVGPERVIVAGMFTTINDSAPTAKRGMGYTVTWVAEGRWKVTLNDAVNAIDCVLVNPAPETLTGELVEAYVDQDSINTNSFEIRLLMNADTSAGASALADDPGAMISFLAVCRIGNHNA